MPRRRRRLQRTALTLFTSIALAMPSALLLSRPSTAQGEEKVKKSDLGDKMGDIDEMMKKLRRTLRKPESNADSLKLIAEIETDMVACKSMVPTKASKVPEPDREKFVTGYRREMAGVIAVFCQIEQWVLDGDNKKAQELYKSITEREDKAHDQFMEKEKK